MQVARQPATHLKKCKAWPGTGRHLLDGERYFFKGILCKLKGFLFCFQPAKHLSSASTLSLITPICFSTVTDDSEEWACEDETVSFSNESQ